MLRTKSLGTVFHEHTWNLQKSKQVKNKRNEVTRKKVKITNPNPNPYPMLVLNIFIVFFTYFIFLLTSALASVMDVTFLDSLCNQSNPTRSQSFLISPRSLHNPDGWPAPLTSKTWRILIGFCYRYAKSRK